MTAPESYGRSCTDEEEVGTSLQKYVKCEPRKSPRCRATCVVLNRASNVSHPLRCSRRVLRNKTNFKKHHGRAKLRCNSTCRRRRRYLVLVGQGAPRSLGCGHLPGVRAPVRLGARPETATTNHTAGWALNNIVVHRRNRFSAPAVVHGRQVRTGVDLAACLIMFPSES